MENEMKNRAIAKINEMKNMRKKNTQKRCKTNVVQPNN